MDPSRIYGYISLVDPQSGQMHLDKGYPDANGKFIPLGRPEHLIQVNLNSLIRCHPERQRRVSISVVEMLRFAQHDIAQS